MIESELIYHNPDIQNHRIDYIEYRKIIEAVDRHIEKEKNPQSNSVELLKAAKEFLYNFPLDCLHDISVGPQYCAISYDCVYGNKKIGAYGLTVNMLYEYVGHQRELYFDTIFDTTIHNKKQQFTVGWKSETSQRMSLDEIKQGCLLNTFPNLELQLRIKNDKYDYDDDFLTVVAKEVYKALNNKYIQAYWSLKGHEEYLFELTPKVILDNRYNPSTIEIECNDDGDVYVELKAGIDPSKSGSFLFEKDIWRGGELYGYDKDDWNKHLNKNIQEIVKAVRDSKSLLYSYSVNSFSDKLFSHKETK